MAVTIIAIVATIAIVTAIIVSIAAPGDNTLDDTLNTHKEDKHDRNNRHQ